MQRFDRVDALRGLAVVWMTVFHLCFDLSQFGVIRQDFYTDPLWTWQRILIVTLFLYCAGLGQAIAVAQGQSWGRFWRRWAQVLGAALLVTAGSLWMFPNSFIYFGVLHGMALMLVLARLTVNWGHWLWGLGGLAIASNFIAVHALTTGVTADFADVFNSPILNWIGWITRKPIAEDYVPLFPWLGVMWWGVASGNSLRCHAALSKPLPVRWAPLALLGRNSLSYYLLHQPVLIAVVWGLSLLVVSG